MAGSSPSTLTTSLVIPVPSSSSSNGPTTICLNRSKKRYGFRSSTRISKVKWFCSTYAPRLGNARSVVTMVCGSGNSLFASDLFVTCLLQPVLAVAGPPFVVATVAVAAVARRAPYLFSGRHVVGLVRACILLLGMMQMMSGAVSSGPAAPASTIDGEHADVCCCEGRAMLGGQWLENTNSAAYPHARFLDSCMTKQGGGAKFARDYQDWRTIPVPCVTLFYY